MAAGKRADQETTSPTSSRGGAGAGAEIASGRRDTQPPPAKTGDFADQNPVDFSATFEARFGRPPTLEEIGALHSYQNENQAVLTPESATSLFGKIYGTVDSEIQRTAKALGKNLTPEQVSSIRENLGIFGDVNNQRGSSFDSTGITNLINGFRPLIQSSIVSSSYISPESAVTDAHKTDVTNLFQTLFNREPTVDEIDYFGKELAKGNTSMYEIRQSLQTHPEFIQLENKKQQEQQKVEAEQARNSLNTQLLESENQAFEKALPQILSSYMRAGRIGSSGVDSAVSRARADLAQKRQDYIANAGFQQAVQQSGYNQQNYVGSQNQAFQQYLRDSAPAYNQSAYQQQFPYQALSQVGARANELQDYYTQQNDYARYLQDAREAQSKSDRYGLYGALAGAAIGGAASAYGSYLGRK